MLFREVTPIATAPVHVFAFFERMAENYRRWHPDHVAFQWLSGDGLHDGATAHFEEVIDGKLLRKTVVFSDVEPDRCLTMAPTSRLFRLVLPRMSFRMEPDGEGCLLTAEIEVRTGPAGAWLNRREFDAVGRHMREEGENLKALLSGEAADADPGMGVRTNRRAGD